MKSALLLSLIAITGACIDQPEDEVTATPRLAVNGMLPSQIQYTNLDQAPLTAAALSTVASTPDGAAFVDYLVYCALDSTQSFTIGFNSYYGSVGLVPAWTTRALTVSERRWVSACILARTNYIGVRQSISIRGTHPALAVAGDEGYTKEEGGYYGDLFSGNTTRRVCAGPATLDGSIDGYQGRHCAYTGSGGTSLCGYTLDAPCASSCTTEGGVYTSCAGWNEVVKVHDF